MPGLLERLYPTPGALRGLLSPEDEQQARRQALLRSGFSLLADSGPSGGMNAPKPLQAIGRAFGLGQDYYNNEIAQRAALNMELQQTELARRQQELQKAAREAALSGLGGVEGPKAVEALRASAARLAATGDIEGAKKLADMIPQYIDDPTKIPAGKAVDLGGKVAFVDPQGNVLQMFDKTPEPLSPSAVIGQALAQSQQQFQRANALRSDFIMEARPFAQVANALGNFMQSKDAALAGDPAAQMSVIFAYMKMLDPGSTVREGEYATAENTTGVPGWLMNLYNKVVDGSFLTAQQVRYFTGQVEAQRKGWADRFQNLAETYRERSLRGGVNPEDVVVDYFARVPSVSNPAQQVDATTLNRMPWLANPNKSWMQFYKP